MKARDPGRRDTPGKVLQERRSLRERGRMGNSVWNAPRALRLSADAADRSPSRRVRLRDRDALGQTLADVLRDVRAASLRRRERLKRVLRGRARGELRFRFADARRQRLGVEGDRPYEATSGWSSKASEAES